MSRHCNLQELFLKNHVEPTQHRQVVLKAVAQFNRAVAPKEILGFIRRDSSIDKVTLYRILDLFVDRHILRRFSGFAGSMCYEIACEEHNPAHPHFSCTQCGKIDCLDRVDINQFRAQFRKKRGMLVRSFDLKIEGLCLNCKKKEKNSEKK